MCTLVFLARLRVTVRTYRLDRVFCRRLFTPLAPPLWISPSEVHFSGHGLANVRVETMPDRLSKVQYVRFAAGRRTQAGDATDRAIDQWRRRLECVVQQQGGYTEHLM